MARKVLQDTYYSFTPSTRTIVINKAIPRERLVLITDVTTNQVIYNFSDSTLTTTGYTISTDSTGAITTTTLVLNYNTTNLSPTDKIQIIVDEYDEKFSPSDVYLDGVNKLRTSQPQSLIDTDFEYSTQQTKWEGVALLNNRPFASYNLVNILTINDIQATSGSRQYVLSPNNSLIVGTPIVILDSLYSGADGVYIVETSNSTAISFTGRNYYTGSTGSTFNSGVTQAYQGSIYSYSHIPLTSVANTAATSNNIQVVTSQPHGLVPGNEFALIGTTQTGSNTVNGSWTVSGVTNSTAFTYFSTNNAGATPSISNNQNGTLIVSNTYITGLTATGNLAYGMIVSGNQVPTLPPTYITGIVNTTAVSISQQPTGATSANAYTFTAALYARPQGITLHRPYDGGIRFSTNSGSHNQQYIRQTRRAFRYQSGKAIEMSTGTTFKPNMTIDSLTSSGTTVTVYTKDVHNLTPYSYVTIAGANEAAYNVTNTPVTAILNPYAFTYTATGTPSSSPASGSYYASASSWYGSATRVGIFDSQNGMFFEFDGQTMYVVKRDSVYQLSGSAYVQAGSSTVVANTSTGTTSAFSKQLIPNDYIVIKGQSYRVTNIVSDTQITIQPAYRGTQNLPNCVLSKTVDTKIPQSSWNIDRADGTGPSGFKVDLTKMQMFYIDYSWYGAGFVRYGMRGADGNKIYLHKILNNNVNYTSYLRSGNLPGRYETNTFGKVTTLASNVNVTQTTITGSNTVGFSPTGTVVVRSADGTAYEYINYTSLNTSTGVFSGLTRAQQGNTVATLTLTSGSTTAVIGTNTGIQSGQYIYGTSIASPTYVVNISGTTVTLSLAATGSASGTYVFAPIGPASNQAFTANTSAPVVIEQYAPQYAAEINHWGTSAIMDGQFTNDKAFIFQKATTSAIQIGSGANNAILSLRPAPSASGGVAGTGIGVREIINRMQLVLNEIDTYSTGQFYVTLVLNGQLSANSGTWTNVGGSSLAQYIDHTTTNVKVSGGEVIFGMYLNSAGGSSAFTTTTADLSTNVRDLGNSIVGGGSSSGLIGYYPDGPDVITVVAQNIGGASANTYCRLAWTEAQA